MQELLNQDSKETQQLAEKLDVTQQAISERLHALGKILKKDANPLRLSIVLSHHMHRNWIGKSEAGRYWL